MKLNTYDLSHKVWGTNYLHGITPFFVKDMIPSDTFDFNNRYVVHMDPASGQVPLAQWKVNILWAFVPYWQVWKEFTNFYNGSGAVTPPSKTVDLNTIGNESIFYHLFPTAGALHEFDINMLPIRAYQKIIFDVFMEKYFKIGGIDIDTEDFYQTTSGTDTTTLTNIFYAPFKSDFYNEIVNEIRRGVTATEITSPFDWDDLKAALKIDNFKVLQRKFGVRVRDFIDKIYGIKRKPQDAVQIVNYYDSPLITNDIMNTDTSQGEIVSKTFGITPKVDFNFQAQDFGVLMGLWYVTSEDTCHSQGVNHELTTQHTGSAYGFHHAEIQGLAYENITKANINIDQASPTDVLGYSEVYGRHRKYFNQATGEYSREALRGNKLPHIRRDKSVEDCLDLYYPDKDTFFNLFSSALHQVTFAADLRIIAQRPVAKVLKEENIVREFDNILIL